MAKLIRMCSLIRLIVNRHKNPEDTIDMEDCQSELAVEIGMIFHAICTCYFFKWNIQLACNLKVALYSCMQDKANRALSFTGFCSRNFHNNKILNSTIMGKSTKVYKK